jgi:hypothetical protein
MKRRGDMPRWRARLLAQVAGLAAFALAALVGCSSGGPAGCPPGSHVLGLHCEPVCTQASDCLPDEVCQSGLCVLPQGGSLDAGPGDLESGAGSDAALTDSGQVGPACGDGVVEMGELCDIAIPHGQAGACPLAADCTRTSTNACLHFTLSGTGCNAACTTVTTTRTVAGDGCCPAGANQNTDPDCTPVCGNGAVEAGESCDTGIPAGQMGACPTDCNTHNICFNGSLVVPGGAPCQAHCSQTPSGHPGCSGACGDGVVEAGEDCDLGIPAGQPGACPMSDHDCATGMPCLVGQLLDPSSCNARCTQTAITTAINGDGCCPTPGEIAPSTDNDCPSLPEYRACGVNSDCQSSSCKAFDTDGGRTRCTSHCTSSAQSLAADCPDYQPSTSGIVAVCLGRRTSNSTTRDPACIAVVLTASTAPPPDAGFLAPGDVANGMLDGTSQLDLYGLLSNGSQRSVVVTPADPMGTLDLSIETLDSALVQDTGFCPDMGPGQQVMCDVPLIASGDRQFVLVTARSGSGGYSIEIQ